MKNIVNLLSILLISCIGRFEENIAKRIMKSICDNDFDYFYGKSNIALNNIDYIINHYPKMLRPIEKEKAYNRAKMLAETGDWIKYGGDGSALDYYKLRQSIGADKCSSIELEDKKDKEYFFTINGSLTIAIAILNGLFFAGDVVE